MTPEVAVRTRLLALSSVTSLVGTRVFMMVLPQHVSYPAIRIQLIDEPIRETVDGETGLSPARVQVDVYAQDRATARQVAIAVHGGGSVSNPTGLQHWKDQLGSPPFDVKLVRRLDSREVEYEPDELRVYRFSLDYEVWVSDGVATV